MCVTPLALLTCSFIAIMTSCWLTATCNGLPRRAVLKHRVFAALQKRQASESEERIKLLEEQCRTERLRTSELHAQVKQYEEQVAAVGSQMERCRNEHDRVLVTLGRLKDNQNRGVESCSSSCFSNMLFASK